VDQHAAHERIIFEQIKTRKASGGGGVQRLLIPETMDLGYKEAKILEQLVPGLETLQLEIEPFGGNTFVIKAIPAILKNREVKPLITEMVEKIAESGFSPGFEKTIDACLMLMACHGAIRANHALSDKEMEHLLDQLQLCSNPDHCPHGRPTFIKYSIKSLEKLFHRIV
jgi:DNA mismatch repair protein MutL